MAVRMEFGKHKGTLVTNLPTGYLNWLLNWMDSEASNWMSHSRTRLFDELDYEYLRRERRPTRAAVKRFAVSAASRSLLPEFIKSGYRVMALKHHPDKGGSDAAMIALKALKDALEKL